MQPRQKRSGIPRLRRATALRTKRSTLNPAPAANEQPKPTPPMLPDDVLHLIAALLPLKDLAAMTRSSRAFHALAIPYLYKKVTIGNSADVPATVKFLINNPRVAAGVTTLEITHHTRCWETEGPELPRLPNLRNFILDLGDRSGDRSSDARLETLFTCLANGYIVDAHHRWEEYTVVHPCVKACALAVNQLPATVVVRLIEHDITEILRGWDSLFPFPKSVVQRLVVISDLNKRSIAYFRDWQYQLQHQPRMELIQICKETPLPARCPFIDEAEALLLNIHCEFSQDKTAFDLTFVDALEAFGGTPLWQNVYRLGKNELMKDFDNLVARNGGQLDRVDIVDYWREGKFDPEWDDELLSRLQELEKKKREWRKLVDDAVPYNDLEDEELEECL